MRLVSIAAAVMVVFSSVLPIASQSDHHALPALQAVTSAVFSDIVSDTPAMAPAGAHCQIGHSCLFLILPINDLVLTQRDSAPEFLNVSGHLPSAQVDMPIHPPRILSQV